MLKTYYKVQDSVTGNFWNGSSNWQAFSSHGRKWNKNTTLEHDLICHLKKQDPFYKIPDTWKIIKFETKSSEVIKNIEPVETIVFSIMLKQELQKLSWRYVTFYNEMVARGVADDVQFILKLKCDVNNRFVSMERIKACRAQLRLLGVLTRTFREASGMFGMMNREQAMKARLTLELEAFVDLNELRNKVRLQMMAPSPPTPTI